MTTKDAKVIFGTDVPVVYKGKKYLVVGLMSFINIRGVRINSVCIRGCDGEGDYWINSQDIENNAENQP